MTIYVDELVNWPQEARTAQARKYFGSGKPSCHLLTDGDEAELVAFARRIGLQPAWIQRGSRLHFDLTPKKRAMAVRAGAVEIAAREFIKMMNPSCIPPDETRSLNLRAARLYQKIMRAETIERANLYARAYARLIDRIGDYKRQRESEQ